MDLKEIEWKGVNWIYLAQCIEHSNEPSGYIKSWESLE
jgi:hypothetical protein